MPEPNYSSPEFYINRELSWLEFNNRVLEEAKSKGNPLFERFKFLAITSSNLDEFFMIRVASLKDQVNAGFNKPDYAGLSPKQQLRQISQQTHLLVKKQYSMLNKSLFPLLKESGIVFRKAEDLNALELQFIEKYFLTVAYPVLTPMAVDSSRPFPLILNKSLNVGVLLKNKDKDKKVLFATVQIPSVLPRMIELPSASGDENKYMILLEEIVIYFINQLFTGREILCAYPYRITRNAGLSIDEEEAQDLLLEIEKSLKKRKWGMAIRLEVHYSIDLRLLKFLKDMLEIHTGDIYLIKGPLDVTFFMKMSTLKQDKNLLYKHYEPQQIEGFLEGDDFFETIRSSDVLLHHPYESFEPVMEFIKRASVDPYVLAIKQTLYRISYNSPIVDFLIQAAENGKQVMVLFEVKARFDEENNILSAKKLEKAGCHVIYGLIGLKTHSKITLVVRKEESGIKRYVHLGTGNYNDITAKIYTDMGLFTANEYIGADASALFNMLSGYSEPPRWHILEAAPLGLRNRFIDLIENERQNAQEGKKAVIIAKMNSLVDPELISRFYKASAAGVEIRLIVRGICSLKPGLAGISENIQVSSIVGRFLEHSRIYYFHNNGKNDIFLSSADLMPRNLDRRVELLFPIEYTPLKERILNILDIELNDTAKTRVLGSDGKYKKVDKRGKASLDSQEYFCKLAMDISEQQEKDQPSEQLEPIYPVIKPLLP